MPWFCHSAPKPKKKRSSHNKTRVGGKQSHHRCEESTHHHNNSNTLSSNSGSSTGGDSSGTGTNNGRSPPSSFAVVLQSFSATLPDELNVQRGQVVEVMYGEGDWSFVRNMDSSAGYVPKTYCLGLDQVKGSFNNAQAATATAAGVPAPRPRVINVDTLQRSGSSVTSVDVRQVNSNLGGMSTTTTTTTPTTPRQSDPIDIPPPPSSPSSSQAIYEVPRSPTHPTSTCATPPSTTTETCPLEGSLGGSQRAPSLPPRSANLPTQAEIQRQLAHTAANSGPAHHRPAYLPGCRQGQNPFTMGMHGGPPGGGVTGGGTGGSPRSLGSSYHPHHQSPLGGNSSSPISKYAHVFSQSYPAPSQGLGHAPQQQQPPSSVATPGSSVVYTPFSVAQRRNTCHAHQQPHPHHHLGAGSRRASGPPTSNMTTLVGRLGNHTPNDGTTAAADTPGSAGVPSVAQSPSSARTPGAPPPGAVTPGYASKPKFASSSSTPQGLSSGRWPGSAMPINTPADTASLCGPRVGPPLRRGRGGNGGGSFNRGRRHSTDVMVLLDSAISEDSDVVSSFPSPPQTVARRGHTHQPQCRRQSQPCVANVGLKNSPSPHRRPCRLPVRRALSMQEHHRNDRTPFSFPRSAMTPGGGALWVGGEVERGGGGAYSCARSVPIHRAPSYQEAVIGEDERRFGVAASIKPSDFRDTPTTSSSPVSHKEACPPPMRRRGGSSRTDGYYSASDTDDVFLPGGAKKPYGIFQCVRQHRQSFKGEISLRKNELVIVLDRGRGHWAWAITSNNTEGLIPKSVLVQYRPDFGAGAGTGGGAGEWVRTDAETQTDVLLCGGGGSSSSECPDNLTSCKDGGAAVSCKSKSAVSCKEKSASRNTSASCEDVTENPTSCNVDPTTTATTTVSCKDDPAPSTPREELASHVIRRSAALLSMSSLTSTSSPDTSPVSTTARSHRSTTGTEGGAAADTESCDEVLAATGTTVSTSSCPKEWFDTLDSVDAAKVVSSIESHRQDTTTTTTIATSVPLSSSLPPSDQAEPSSAAGGANSSKKQTSPQGKPPHGGRKASGIPRRKRGGAATSRPQSSQAPQGRGAADSGEGAEGKKQDLVLVRKGTAHYHDRISGLGSVSFDEGSDDHTTTPPPKGKAGGRREGQSTPPRHRRGLGLKPSSILTAVRDYAPPASAKNCLPLEKGDVLHSQPHMHYPKGWMWVWHAKRRSFGFVPKSHVAYTYDTPPRERQRTESVEDEV